MAQTIRCYTPADLLLLLEGTGLSLKEIEVKGEPVDWNSGGIVTDGPLMKAYAYQVMLMKD